MKKETAAKASARTRVDGLGLAFLAICLATALSTNVRASSLTPELTNRKNEIRALTFNGGLLQVANYSVVPMLRPRAALIPEAVAAQAVAMDADLVALQEIWSDSTAHSIRTALETRGYSTYRRNLKLIVGNGLVLAVRAPWTIQRADLHLFRRSTMAELFSKKGFVLAQLRNELSGERLNVITTHLQAQDTDDRGRSKNVHELKAIKAQIDQIRETIERLPYRLHTDGRTLEREPVLLLGDLNTGPNSVPEAFEYLQSKGGFEDLNPNLLNTWSSENPLVRASRVANKNDAMLDHCLVQSGSHFKFAARQTEIVLNERYEAHRLRGNAIPLSDHYGLSCRFAIEDSLPEHLRLAPPTSLHSPR